MLSKPAQIQEVGMGESEYSQPFYGVSLLSLIRTKFGELKLPACVPEIVCITWRK